MKSEFISSADEEIFLVFSTRTVLAEDDSLR